MGTPEKVSQEYTQGDIVWVNFPFVQNPSESKKRPAVIISNNSCHKSDTGDYILAAVTKTIRVTPYSFFLDSKSLSKSMPERDCEVRANKLFTTSKKNLDGRMSQVLPSKIDELIQLVCSALSKDK